MLKSAYRIQICYFTGSAEETHVEFQRDCPEP